MKTNTLKLAIMALLFTTCTSEDSLLDLSKGSYELNGSLSSRSSETEATYSLYMAEYLTSGETDEMGSTVFFNNRGNKQLSADFVPGDPRRGNRVNINYLVDNQLTTDNGLTATAVTGAIDNAMSTWDTQTCSDLGITKVPFNGNAGFVSLIRGFGGSLNFVDVQHCGFLPAAFFNTLAPNGSAFILGVTFTLIWTVGGVPTDIDNNGKADVAFREIYYNDRFTWNTNGANVDIETVSLHESGHGLSQGHFGKAFRTLANGKLHFSPRAVMNAAYSGVQREVTGTDNGGHCSNWGSWPNE